MNETTVSIFRGLHTTSTNGRTVCVYVLERQLFSVYYDFCCVTAMDVFRGLDTLPPLSLALTIDCL